MKSFVPNAAMVHTRSFGPSSSSSETSMPEQSKFTDPIVLVDDEVVKISAIILQPSCMEGSKHLSKTPKNNDVTEPARSNNKPGDISVVYVCELPEVKGKFDPAKAAGLGLRPGPKYRELQLGNSVKSDRQDIMVGFHVI